MREQPTNDEPKMRSSSEGLGAWIDPEVSEPKDLIGYPDGLILQGASGDV